MSNHIFWEIYVFMEVLRIIVNLSFLLVVFIVNKLFIKLAPTACWSEPPFQLSITSSQAFLM